MTLYSSNSKALNLNNMIFFGQNRNEFQRFQTYVRHIVTSHQHLWYHCQNHHLFELSIIIIWIVRNRNERTPSRESANYKDSNTTLHKSSISGPYHVISGPYHVISGPCHVISGIIITSISKIIVIEGIIIISGII